MHIYKGITDTQADKYIFTVLLLIAVSCVSGAVGMLFLVPLVAVMAMKCDIKLLPAIMLAMVGPDNIVAIGEYSVVRFGITIKPESMLIITTFFLSLNAVLKGRFNKRGAYFFPFWILSAVPAMVISFSAKYYHTPDWSNPIMQFMIPSLFYWGVLMSKSYYNGRVYFFKRTFWVMTAICALYLAQFLMVGSYLRYSLIVTMGMYLLLDSKKEVRMFKLVLLFAVVAAFLEVTIGRYLHMMTVGKEALDAEKNISGFSVLGTFLMAIVVCYLVRKRVSFAMRLLPCVLLLANIILIVFVVSTQSGNKYVSVDQQFSNMEERFKYKLYGDRATVWAEGWEQLKEPPYIFVDLRKFECINPLTGRIGTMVPPHNQVLTTLTRTGLWLGGTLLLFTLWVQMKAFSSLHECGQDGMLRMVFLPTSCAVFFIIGTCGQSVITTNLWNNALACYVMPGIIVGSCYAVKVAHPRGICYI